MADMAQLERALVNADAAGDADAARALAAEIRRMRGATVEKAPNPTEGNSFGQNLAAGVGGAIVDLGLGLKQRLDDAAAGLERRFGGEKVNAALGLPNAVDVQKQTQAAVDEKRRIDAPLMKTAGGKVGEFATKAVPAIGAMMLPGGQTLAGSVIANTVLEAAQPTATGESATKNALIGGASAGVGYGLGKLLGIGVNKLVQGSAEKAAARQATTDVAKVARDAGYVIPPTQTNPNTLNKALEGLSGKVATAQAASVKNQPVTNRLAAEAVGLEADRPITREALDAVRSEAGKAYNAVRAAGTLKADAQYADDLAKIVDKYRVASKDFPELAQNDVANIVASVNKPQFSADAALDAIKILRERATKAYRMGDDELGAAYRSTSNALEGAIERNLQAAGAPAQQILKAFRDARQLIAKTYSVEEALNPTTGNVIAGKLGKQLAKSAPLSGELKTIAQFSQAFPKAGQEISSSFNGISPLDYTAANALMTLSGNPLTLAGLVARPAARTVLLSSPYQRTMGVPGNALIRAMTPERGNALTQLLSQGGAVSGAALPRLLNFQQQ